VSERVVVASAFDVLGNVPKGLGARVNHEHVLMPM
jgi:hypothetical protein